MPRIFCIFLCVINLLPVLHSEVWEDPLVLGKGGFPSLLTTKTGYVLLWQQSSRQNGTGNTIIYRSVFDVNTKKWQSAPIANRSFYFSRSPNAPPTLLYSAGVNTLGHLIVAVADSANSIEIYSSLDNGITFKLVTKVLAEINILAPRIFASATGGWLLFATTPIATKDAAGISPGLLSLGIVLASSPDGKSWTKFAALDPKESNTHLLPSLFSSQGRDIVYFQKQVLQANISPHFVLAHKISRDKGISWTEQVLLHEAEAIATNKTNPLVTYDNQRPLVFSGNNGSYLVWERRRLDLVQTEVWAAKLDIHGNLQNPQMVSPKGRSFFISDIFSDKGLINIAITESTTKNNRILICRMQEGTWVSEELSIGQGIKEYAVGYASFVRFFMYENRSYAILQLDNNAISNLYYFPPLSFVPPPILVARNFTAGRASREENARIEIQTPTSKASIKEYRYLWVGPAYPDYVRGNAYTKEEVWANGKTLEKSNNILLMPANTDGKWELFVMAEDTIGNRSRPATITFYRLKTLPASPVIIPPRISETGGLVSNTGRIEWVTNYNTHLAGYTWDFRYLGTKVPFQSDLPKVQLAPGSLGLSNYYLFANIINGYYYFTVSAIDKAGNISPPASLLLKLDKFIPYTEVVLAIADIDKSGRTRGRMQGQGFTSRGSIISIVLDKDGLPPYDLRLSKDSNGYRIVSDRLIDEMDISDLKPGSYRIGLLHSSRGWYWKKTPFSVQLSGTFKTEPLYTYTATLKTIQPNVYPYTFFNIYTVILLLLGAVGIFLSSKAVFAHSKEIFLIKKQALALLQGGAMPITNKSSSSLASYGIKKQRLGLRLKFSMAIISLVLVVVALLSFLLGSYLVRNTSLNLSRGLDQRARVLLESAALGGRFFLGRDDAIAQLSFIPSQISAVQGATYITISGNTQIPQVSSATSVSKMSRRDIVFATNDPGIANKLEPSELSPEGNIRLGVSAFSITGKDALAKDIPAISASLESRARELIMIDLGLKTELLARKASLSPGLANASKLKEINDQLDTIDLGIRLKLRNLSDEEVGVLPPFDINALQNRSKTLLYYKPIVDYRPNDGVLYRGMVRLEVETNAIDREVRNATNTLIQLTLIIAVIALAIGVVGALVLSTIIVVPIRRLVSQIERIRDTDDKEKLQGSRIEVRARDELFILAETVNQMTDGLVKAAKASKELIVGKGIQKIFIPLDTDPQLRTKLNTGSRKEKNFEIFGYYEGAKGVSGDYWDFRSINERYHYFIKCDISGKGVSASLIMVQVATMVINYFNDWKKKMPNAIKLTELAYIINDFLEERGFVGRFAAFTLGIWDSEEGLAHIVVAGDLKLYIWDHAQNRLVEELMAQSLDECAPAAGMFPSTLVKVKQPYRQFTRRLNPGDTLILFTDGIAESKRYFRDSGYNIVACAEAAEGTMHLSHEYGSNNEEFGLHRIKGILQALAHRRIYTLQKPHDPVGHENLSFNFTEAGKGTTSPADFVLALVAIEKIYRMYVDPKANEKDLVLVDNSIDEFLSRYFRQYSLFSGNKKLGKDVGILDPGYIAYSYMKEEEPYDDITILAIQRKNVL